MNGKKLSFETITSNYEQVNPEFMRVKINVCYAGQNRNGTSIERSVLDNMVKSVYGVPVVGEIDFDEMKFKGHGGKLEISDEGWKEIKTTIPYGFVDPVTPAYYERVLEVDGMTYNEYLTVSAYLWRGRYPELDEIFEKESVKQSMEIIVEDGNWDDNYSNFNITKARFQALCLLGVEPCFESAKATVGYSLDDKQRLYQEMLDTFKQFTLEATGGEEMDKTEVVETKEVEVKEVEEVKAQHEEVVEGQAETEIEEVTAEPVKEEVATEEFQEEVSTVDETVDEGVVEEVQEDVVDYQAKYEELEVKYNELNDTYSQLVQAHEDMKVEFTRLSDFEAEVLADRRKNSEDELLNAYETQLGEVEEFAQLKANASDYSLEELENKCLIILGKQAKQTFSAKQSTKQKVADKIKFEANVVQDRPRPYGGLLD